MPPKLLHQLCPDAVTLDTFLSRKTGFFFKQVYTIGAILELVPAWLRFLESRMLLDADQKSRIITDLLPILQSWCELLRKMSTDQLLLSNIAVAWEEKPC